MFFYASTETMSGEGRGSEYVYGILLLLRMIQIMAWEFFIFHVATTVEKGDTRPERKGAKRKLLGRSVEAVLFDIITTHS